MEYDDCNDNSSVIMNRSEFYLVHSQGKIVNTSVFHSILKEIKIYFSESAPKENT